MKNKKLLFPLIYFILFFLTKVCAQEPGNNIGKTFSAMKQQFPELRYIETNQKGVEYEVGYPQDGIAMFMYFKNNKVVEECLIVQSDNDFSRMWFDKMKDSFLENYPSICGINEYNRHIWCYSTFTVHLVFIQKNGLNNAMIIYEEGGCGYPSGMTRKEFIEKYE